MTYITQEAAKAQKKLRPLGHNIDRFGNTDRYEVPTREPADYTEPLLQVIHPDGVRSLRLIYESHKIEENHLVVFARDAVYPFAVEMHYQGWAELPLISRWLVLKNGAEQPVYPGIAQERGLVCARGAGLPAHPSFGQLGRGIRKKSIDAHPGAHRAGNQ